MGWVNDFDSGPVKTIGLLEILAGLTLIVPPVRHRPARSRPRGLAPACSGRLIGQTGAEVVTVLAPSAGFEPATPRLMNPAVNWSL